jgi:hypothetical protein
LLHYCANGSETFAPNGRNDRFGLHGMNGPQIHRLLARMTDYVETSSGQASRYAEYAQRGRKGYEIEQIWVDHPERHADEFTHASEFQEYRNRMGGLLLLPKSFNASYGDLPYAEKREHYAGHGQNLLARSLHDGLTTTTPVSGGSSPTAVFRSAHTPSSERPTSMPGRRSIGSSRRKFGVRTAWRGRGYCELARDWRALIGRLDEHIDGGRRRRSRARSRVDWHAVGDALFVGAPFRLEILPAKVRPLGPTPPEQRRRGDCGHTGGCLISRA